MANKKPTKKRSKKSSKKKPATPKQPDDGTIILPELLFEDAAAKNDVRHYLNAPYLDLSGDKPILVATNGHLLLSVECEITGQVSQGWLSLEAIKRVRKESPKWGAAVMHFKDDMHGTGDVMFKRPDMGNANYPDWRKVLFEYDDTARPDICFNADYMHLISKALNTGNAKKWNGTGLIAQREKAKTKVKPINPRGAVAVRATNPNLKDVKYHAILMPMAWSR